MFVRRIKGGGGLPDALCPNGPILSQCYRTSVSTALRADNSHDGADADLVNCPGVGCKLLLRGRAFRLRPGSIPHSDRLDFGAPDFRQPGQPLCLLGLRRPRECLDHVSAFTKSEWDMIEGD